MKEWHDIKSTQPLNRVPCIIRWKDGTETPAKQWYGVWENAQGERLDLTDAVEWRFAKSCKVLRTWRNGRRDGLRTH